MEPLYIVNVHPKVTTDSTNAGVVVTQVATVCHPVTVTTPEVTPSSCSPCKASKELDVNKHVCSTLSSGLSDVDVDGMEFCDPSDIHALSTFWEVKEGHVQRQVTDVQGRLLKISGSHTPTSTVDYKLYKRRLQAPITFHSRPLSSAKSAICSRSPGICDTGYPGARGESLHHEGPRYPIHS